jgi:hypothetical protein
MLTAGEVFSRLAGAVEVLGWHLSQYTAPAFEGVPDGAERSHKSVSLHMPETSYQAGRQRALQYAISTVEVRWLYRMRPSVRLDDYVAALAAEPLLVGALVGVSPHPGLTAIVSGPLTRRELDASTGPMLLGFFTLSVPHSLTVEPPAGG